MHDIDLMLQYQLEGKKEEARALSDKLEALGPDKVLDLSGQNTKEIWMRHSFNRGWFLLNDGDYQAGCQHLENGRYLNVYGSSPLRTNAPIFNPFTNSIKGKSIIISLEGGFGDEMIHARFATSFKKQGASKVYLAAAPELVSLFSRIEGVDKVILRNEANTVAHDFWVPGFSAGWISGATFDNFPSDPYLSALPESKEIWRSVIKCDEGKKKIGIRWAGNPKFEHQQFRKFPTNFITNLVKYNDKLEIFSFQKDHNIIELPKEITDLQHLLISWEDTAAAISQLDLMITSCTSIAHLAAALGVETWVIVPCLPYHTWAYKAPESTTTPYYKTVKIYRQKEGNKWNETFQQLYKDLENKYDLNHIELPNEEREPKRLNLGCGLNKYNNYLNVDRLETVKPDQIVDLNMMPWPWKDNEFTHIVAKDILEHLGESQKDIIGVIKEMYRISEGGAVWEIQVPHWRCDTAITDPTHVRLITPKLFDLFNQKSNMDEVLRKTSQSLLAYETDIDIEVCDIQFQYTEMWDRKIRNNEITEEELIYALNYFNNVALSTKILIQVHKPGRYTKEEFEKEIKLISE